MNDGICLVDYMKASYYKCSCKYGYTGKNCELKSSNLETHQVRLTTRLYVNCVDQNEKTCPMYARNKLCSDMMKINGVSINDFCPKSCHFCDSLKANRVSNKCVDLNSSCFMWSASNACSRLPDPNVCKKSCKLC